MKENIIGQRLRSLRESIKLSQAKLAKLIGSVAQPAVNRFENGIAVPSAEILNWYADYFSVSLDYIFGRTDNPHGAYYDCKPPINENNEELKQFVEMCFDPESSLNERLKEAMFKLLEEQKK